MKITKILIWITYISLAVSIVVFGIFGFMVSKNGFNIQNVEKGSLEGVVSKSTTRTIKLPMNLDVEYYLRIRESKVLVDSYFFKIQRKSISDNKMPQDKIVKSDYPEPLNENFYSMPETESYLFLPTTYSSIEEALTIWKFYSIFSLSFLSIAIFFFLKFLKNCDMGMFFISQNSTYLKLISYLAIGFSLLDYASQWLITREIKSNLKETIYLQIDTEFDWKYLIISLFLVMIAQAFSEGTKLKEEQSLTI